MALWFPFEVQFPLDVYHFTGGGASPTPGEKFQPVFSSAICALRTSYGVW